MQTEIVDDCGWRVVVQEIEVDGHISIEQWRGDQPAGGIRLSPEMARLLLQQLAPLALK